MGLLALLVAFVCFLVVTVLGFGIFSGAHILGWLGLGLVAWVLSALLGAAGPYLGLVRGQ